MSANENDATAEIVRLVDEGLGYREIAEQLGLHPITVSGKYLRATTERAKVPATAARVRKDRDGGEAWARIAAKYGITKAKAHALYDEAPEPKAKTAKK